MTDKMYIDNNGKKIRIKFCSQCPYEQDESFCNSELFIDGGKCPLKDWED